MLCFLEYFKSVFHVKIYLNIHKNKLLEAKLYLVLLRFMLFKKKLFYWWLMIVYIIIYKKYAIN